MLRVCERCDAWIEEIVVSDDGAAVCPHCGHRRPFLRLPPFQATGASGAGKTRVCRDLPAALPECVMQQFNRWLKANAAATTPPLTLLDTTARGPAETVAAVARWVRERLD